LNVLDYIYFVDSDILPRCHEIFSGSFIENFDKIFTLAEFIEILRRTSFIS